MCGPTLTGHLHGRQIGGALLEEAGSTPVVVRTDYEEFSHTLPDEYFPKGANWLMLGPSGPRRLRLSIEHLAQYRGGICFCVDLDPRWVIKLIQKGWMEHLEAYKQHCIDQAITILEAGHDVRCMFTTPKLLESLAIALEKKGTTIRKAGITGIFSGGTEFTPQWTRFAVEELLDGAYMTPTYGNTLMGLAASRPVVPADGYTIAYYAPQPRAVIEVVDFDDLDRVVPYGGTGRVRLTTLTKETFIPGFLERDEGMPVVPPVSKTYIGWSAMPFGTQRRTGPPRSHSSSNGGNFLRSSKPFTSLSGSNGSDWARSSQNGQPVDGWKCQAIISTVWESSRARAAATAASVATSKTGAAGEATEAMREHLEREGRDGETGIGGAGGGLAGRSISPRRTPRTAGAGRRAGRTAAARR